MSFIKTMIDNTKVAYCSELFLTANTILIKTN